MILAAPRGLSFAPLAGLFGSLTPSPRPGGRGDPVPDGPAGGGSIRIETERLVLRPHRADDFPEHCRLAADPSTFRYSERGPMGREEAWTLLLRQAGHWALAGYGVFAVEEKTSGRYVGSVGPSHYQRGLGADFDPFPEMCWSIVRRCRRRGFAVEAAAAALDWTRRSRGEARSVCLIHEDNLPSIAVASALGYRPFRFCAYRGYSAVLLEREGCDEPRR